MSTLITLRGKPPARHTNTPYPTSLDIFGASLTSVLISTLTGTSFEKQIQLHNTVGQLLPNATVLHFPWGVCISDGTHSFDISTQRKWHQWWQLRYPNIPLASLWSSLKQPDWAIFCHKTARLFVFELKYQQVAGSVSEKLMIAPILLDHYKKAQQATASSPNSITEVQLHYILNDWFQHRSFSTMFELLSPYAPAVQYHILPKDLSTLPATLQTILSLP